jgi:hypothetical protein
MAKKYLAKSTINRNVSQDTVRNYSRDMEEGNWDLNGGTIVFDEDGRLLDGQHRLLACLKANTPFKTFVTTGVEGNARLTIDAGKKRTFGNQLQIMGHKNSNALAAAIQNSYYILAGSLARRLTHHELLSFLEKYPRLSDSASYIANNNVIVPKPSILAAVHFLATEFSSNPSWYQGEGHLADEFASVFHSGVPFFPKHDPAHIWRERLVREKAKPHSILPRKSMLDGTVHSWNMFHKGTLSKQFKIPKVVKMNNLPDIETLDLGFKI